MKQTLKWKLAHSRTLHGVLSDWIPASVPGCVQMDMAAAAGLPLYFTGDHEEEYAWMEDCFWHYQTEFAVAENSGVPFLRLNAVDYEYDLLIDGALQFHHEGMFTARELDLSPWNGQTISAEVVVYPAPKAPGSVFVRGLGNEASQSCKPAFSYGWDWCPRFVTLGLADEAYVEYRPEKRLTDVQIAYRLSEDLQTATITLKYAANVPGTVRCRLFAPDGAEVLCKELLASDAGAEWTLLKPQLWWPHNHGAQPVYTVAVSLLVGGEEADTHTRKLGLRRARLVTNENTWAEQMIPEMKSCAKPPMTLEINGRRIFAKGSNWVPPEMCRAQMNREHIYMLLTLLKDANMNIIRIWGGGYIHPDWFYDLCDELGILVWQEFPLACADYRDNEHYLAVLKQESASIICQLRTHPCLVLWCGGNELFTDWSRMTPQHKAMRLLDAQTYELDPDTPFLYTSPQDGVAHGAYEMLLANGKETLTEFCDNAFSAYTEFGCGAPSEWDYLGTFMTEEERSHPFAFPIWDKRHAVRWFHPEQIRKLTGCTEDWEDVVRAGNEAQCIMYASMFEEVRRQWPHASMAINWCYNEPWPTAAGNGLVNYPAKPRPSYAAVKEALRPQKLSLRFSRIAWRPGEELELSAWLLNDSALTLPALTAAVSLQAGAQAQTLGQTAFETVPAWENRQGASWRFCVPQTKNGHLILRITSPEHPELNAEYHLFVHKNAI